jgi:hypothetical protein
VRKRVDPFILLWLASYSALCYAQSTLAEDLAGYDWVSLLLAFAAGLVGGAARTILTLVSNEQLVGNVRLVLIKDMVVALFGGAAAFLLIQGYNSWAAGLTSFELPGITRDFRVLIIVAAGASRGRWLGILDRFAADAIANARHKLRGDAAPEPPASMPAPLGDR